MFGAHPTTHTVRMAAGRAALLAVCLSMVTPLVADTVRDGTLFEPARVESDLVLLRWDAAALREARDAGSPFVVERFRLPSGKSVSLRLEPFFVTSESTRFVVGNKNGPDRQLDFDAGTLSLFRGQVVGWAGSHVFLALSDGVTTGSIDLGDGAQRYGISSRDRHGEPLASDTLSVYEARGAASLPPHVPLCGVEGALPHVVLPLQGAPQPIAGLKHLEIAVETDYEFFQLFGDAEDSAAYLVALYAAMSDIYLRDVDTWIELVFARIWEDPDDLFNDVDPTPIFDFQDHWNLYMSGVHRDVAQLISGRRDYPFGGQGYISALCSDSAYSVVGYASGVLSDPTKPSPYQYDLSVAAHELGHNAGTGHTQNEGIDTCHVPTGTPQRGTIMSYCGQTWSGGNANRDPYFHAIIQDNIEGHVNNSGCVVSDCNRNGIDDASDVLLGSSADANTNGVPDECEDCNGNSVLDDQDIASATSADLNANGVPDECEPDCDGNDIPDDKQIADGVSLDEYGNDIPDACETDCNQNQTSDYTEIQADMSLDVDRNAILDACQDCDTDGTPDHVAMAGGHDLWVASGIGGSPIREFHPTTGVKVATSSGGAGSDVQEGQDLIIAPGGRVLVSSGADHRVMEFDLDGVYQGDLVPPSLGGLSGPTGLLLASDGTLLVASRDTDSVLAYDATSGAFLGPFVFPGSGGLAGPFGMTWGSDGDLYVTSATNEILVFDGDGGTYARMFVPAARNGGLDEPRGLTFKPDGNLLVASFGTNEVLEYEAGGGAPLGKWAQVGTASVLTQVSPWGIRIGPNGNVFVVRTGDGFGSLVVGGHHDHHDEDDTVGDDDGHDDDDGFGEDSTSALHLSNAQVYEYDVTNGNFIRTLVGGNDHGLLFPTGFDFVPGWEVDCNFNLLPDACDVASGSSADADASGVPDECETDCNGNGTIDRLDVVPYGPHRDCNTNLVPDSCDVADGTSDDCNADGTPDECEPDCNANLVPDPCEIELGLVSDCNSNGIPDLCDATFAFEQDQGWSAMTFGDTATSGTWIRTNPNGSAAQTDFDRTPGSGRECYVTGQGPIGGDPDVADVDGGKTTLTSPVLDLGGAADPEIGYWRWLSNDVGANPGADVLAVEVSNDAGSNWSSVEVVGPVGSESSGGWFFNRFRVADLVTPTANVRLRFVASDDGGDSTVEAAVDDVVILPECCESVSACDDGLVCTVEACNQAAGQCSHEITTGSCLIGAACYVAGQLNPLNDCQACDPAHPTIWSGAEPTEVQGVAVDHTGTTDLAWADQGPGVVYDVAGGLVTSLLADAGATAAICLVSDAAGTSWQDPRPEPPSGDAYYYLVRSQKSCGVGTYGVASTGAERMPAADCP